MKSVTSRHTKLAPQFAHPQAGLSLLQWLLVLGVLGVVAAFVARQFS
jgi:hypothetical protein